MNKVKSDGLSFLTRRISITWQNVQRDHLTRQKIDRLPWRWTAASIQKLFLVAWTMWKDRCNVKHSTVTAAQQREEAQLDTDIEEHCQAGTHGVECFDRAHLQLPHNQQDRMNMQQKKRWLNKAEAMQTAHFNNAISVPNNCLIMDWASLASSTSHINSDADASNTDTSVSNNGPHSIEDNSSSSWCSTNRASRQSSTVWSCLHTTPGSQGRKESCFALTGNNWSWHCSNWRWPTCRTANSVRQLRQPAWRCLPSSVIMKQFATAAWSVCKSARTFATLSSSVTLSRRHATRLWHWLWRMSYPNSMPFSLTCAQAIVTGNSRPHQALLPTTTTHASTSLLRRHVSMLITDGRSSIQWHLRHSWSV